MELSMTTLTNLNANRSEIEELLSYNENVFQQDVQSFFSFPLVSEPYVADWERYLYTANKIGVYQSLKSTLIQFNFPVKTGISKQDDYQVATRKGTDPGILKSATGLKFNQPQQLQLIIYQTLAGSIPVIITENREDFVLLIQALTKRNEPVPIPESMGACIIGGYNNWDRIREYRKEWSLQNPQNCSEQDWKIEFKKLIPQKELYQDRFIVISSGFYSNVSAEKLGLTNEQWLKLSLKIRLEHECTHYFTRRVFGSMRNNILDELIADYRGIVTAYKEFRADWFLLFMGLESFPKYRPGGRLENYRGEPPLSDEAFKILQALLYQAAKNLESFDHQYFDKNRTLIDQVSMLIALTKMNLIQLASSNSVALLEEAVNKQKTKLVFNY
jgi:hypothetical protein